MLTPAWMSKQYARVPITEAEAIAAVRGDTEGEGLEFHAVRLEGTELWAVGATEDATGMPLAGTLTVVGPDRRVWRFSSNPGIHDPHLVVASLAALYHEGVTKLVEEDRLADRIAEATQARRAQERDIVKDAQAGSLRTPPDRRLP
jgi:hypothetical protein